MRTFLAVMFIASLLLLAAGIVGAITGPAAYVVGIGMLVVMFAFQILRPRR